MTDNPRTTCRLFRRRPDPTNLPHRRRPQESAASAVACRRDQTIRNRPRPRAPEAAPGAGFVDVTIVDFAAHTAYLEPFSGTGFLVLPPPDVDVPPPDDLPVEIAAADPDSHQYVDGLSLLTADWIFALSELDQLGWILLDDDDGRLESAGRTSDGRVAVCLYGDSPIIEEPSRRDLRRALAALRIAAGLTSEERWPPYE
ncbi:hypothetical protein [Kribbella sp. CA-293567]|uniref:hypothetical protein n=1 Tax=Kribbella sp. CA-293567 TaxID=3002436 RepID=UPI0022DE7A4A|nr:hypothetical protein [Kribbella sp. CA-293567]WBQ03394.1 hypothetical protein OX958_25885 [Kribbella sp. CA-293567]